jgi:hypothetical protein
MTAEDDEARRLLESMAVVPGGRWYRMIPLTAGALTWLAVPLWWPWRALAGLAVMFAVAVPMATAEIRYDAFTAELADREWPIRSGEYVALHLWGPVFASWQGMPGGAVVRGWGLNRRRAWRAAVNRWQAAAVGSVPPPLRPDVTIELRKDPE